MMINTFSVLFEVSKQQTVSDYKLTNCINKAGTQPLDMLDIYYHYKLCKPMINVIAVTLLFMYLNGHYLVSPCIYVVTIWCHPVY